MQERGLERLIQRYNAEATCIAPATTWTQQKRRGERGAGVVHRARTFADFADVGEEEGLGADHTLQRARFVRSCDLLRELVDADVRHALVGQPHNAARGAAMVRVLFDAHPLLDQLLERGQGHRCSVPRSRELTNTPLYPSWGRLEL